MLRCIRGGCSINEVAVGAEKMIIYEMNSPANWICWKVCRISRVYAITCMTWELRTGQPTGFRKRATLSILKIDVKGSMKLQLPPFL